MIVIYTGIEEIDKELQMNLRDSIIARYSEYLIENNTFEGQTAIISPQAIEGNLHEFLFTLKEMNMKLENKDSYIPNYTRTDLTDDLHDKFGFRTDYEVIDIKKFNKIFTQIKK